MLDGLPPLDFNAPIILEGDEDLDHIILETGSNILMETGHRTLNEDQGFVTRGSKDRLLLERGGPDSVLLAESDRHAFPVGFSVNIGERLLLEDDHDEQTIPISDISNI